MRKTARKSNGGMRGGNDVRDREICRLEGARVCSSDIEGRSPLGAGQVTCE